MEVMLESKQKVSELFHDLTIYPQLLVNVKVKSKPEAKADPDVCSLVADIERELGEEGRILIRESGTEPVIRVMVEAKTDELCSQYVYQVVDLLKAKGHSIN
jgi:phosphoglucosamine mutase